MRKTIYKCFAAWDFEKEEKWLNEMSAIGFALVAVGFCKYTFEDSSPSKYTIRLELLEKSATHIESMKYIEFLEDAGAEYLGSVMMRWGYFRRKNNLGNFDLYSDFNSRIKHLKRILILLGAIGGLNFFAALSVIRVGLEMNQAFMITFSLVNFSVALLCGLGFMKTLGKKNKLQNDKKLFE